MSVEGNPSQSPERGMVIGLVIGAMAKDAAERLNTGDHSAIRADVATQIANLSDFGRTLGIEVVPQPEA